MRAFIVFAAMMMIASQAWAQSPITLTWDDYAEKDKIIGFKLYERDREFGERVMVADIQNDTDTVVVVTPQAIGTRCYVLTAYSETEESGFSNEVCTATGKGHGAPRSMTIRITPPAP